MKNQRPYLLRAFYDWIVDSDATPYMLVNVASDAVQVPADFVSNGQIILNIAPAAVRDLLIDDEAITFDGRFSGQSFPVRVPLGAVAAIYAKENGQGMMFEAVSEEASSAEPPPTNPATPPKGTHLKVIK